MLRVSYEVPGQFCTASVFTAAVII